MTTCGRWVGWVQRPQTSKTPGSEFKTEIKLLKRALNLNAGAKKEVAWGEVVPEEIQNRLPTPLPPLSSRR